MITGVTVCGCPVFYSRRQFSFDSNSPNGIFQLLPCKNSLLPCHAQGGPYGLVGWEKIILAALRYFFPPSLAVDRAKAKQWQVRNRNTGSKEPGM